MQLDSSVANPETRVENIRQRFPVSKRKLAAFYRRYDIIKFALFGSVLRTDFRPDSDIDILVEFAPGKTPGFLRLAEIEDELSSLAGNRKIDLRTEAELSRYFRDRVQKEAIILCP